VFSRGASSLGGSASQTGASSTLRSWYHN
jgi:hypothetical protein